MVRAAVGAYATYRAVNAAHAQAGMSTIAADGALRQALREAAHEASERYIVGAWVRM